MTCGVGGWRVRGHAAILLAVLVQVREGRVEGALGRGVLKPTRTSFLDAVKSRWGGLLESRSLSKRGGKVPMKSGTATFLAARE